MGFPGNDLDDESDEAGSLPGQWILAAWGAGCFACAAWMHNSGDSISAIWVAGIGAVILLTAIVAARQ
jgi:uncharacterized membrane protein YeaQ/YmgE (transglycosylase-associated protein family)